MPHFNHRNDDLFLSVSENGDVTDSQNDNNVTSRVVMTEVKHTEGPLDGSLYATVTKTKKETTSSSFNTVQNGGSTQQFVNGPINVNVNGPLNGPLNANTEPSISPGMLLCYSRHSHLECVYNLKRIVMFNDIGLL